MDTAKVKYLGDLRCEAVHVRSGQRIVTDAPPDNQGRGETFSPSDLTSTSLACCMMTIMGIAARDRGWDISGMEARVVKHMASDPRRIAKVEVHISFDGRHLDAKARTILERAAHTCPVALSLREDLAQEIVFDWQERP